MNKNAFRTLKFNGDSIKFYQLTENCVYIFFIYILKVFIKIKFEKKL